MNVPPKVPLPDIFTGIVTLVIADEQKAYLLLCMCKFSKFRKLLIGRKSILT